MKNKYKILIAVLSCTIALPLFSITPDKDPSDTDTFVFSHGFGEGAEKK